MHRSSKQLKPLALQSKKNSSIAELSKNLFDKIGTIEVDGTCKQDIPMMDVGRQIDSHYDSLTELLTKAQSITNLNQAKISESKRKNQLALARDGGTFLTGTGLYERQNLNIQERNLNQEMPEGPSPTAMLKQLMEKDENDDLAELRRMIKETDENITACHKKVAKTHKNIMHYVEESYEGTKKKSQSTRFIKTRFR